MLRPACCRNIYRLRAARDAYDGCQRMRLYASAPSRRKLGLPLPERRRILYEVVTDREEQAANNLIEI